MLGGGLLAVFGGGLVGAGVPTGIFLLTAGVVVGGEKIGGSIDVT